MSEFYYESEIQEIMQLVSDTTLGRYGVEEEHLTLVDHHQKTQNLKSNLANREIENPLLDYKAYLLYESLFIFDWISEYHSYIIEDVPIPLYCFKRGSKELQGLWHSNDVGCTIMKQEYYSRIKEDMNHVPSVEGELAELELFFEQMRRVLNVDYVDSQLNCIGLSYDSLVGRILVPGWREHEAVARWNKIYTAEDWMNHSVL